MRRSAHLSLGLKKKNISDSFSISHKMADTVSEAMQRRYSKENRWYYKTIDDHISPDSRDLLTSYSHVPSEEVDSHVYKIVSSSFLLKADLDFLAARYSMGLWTISLCWRIQILGSKSSITPSISAHHQDNGVYIHFRFIIWELLATAPVRSWMLCSPRIAFPRPQGN